MRRRSLGWPRDPRFSNWKDGGATKVGQVVVEQVWDRTGTCLGPYGGLPYQATRQTS